jgi:hypothetical protein
VLALVGMGAETCWGVTQDEVFRSIQKNVGHSSASTGFLWVMLGMASIVMLLVLLSHVRKREVTPKVLNHPGKLAKELAKAIDLRSDDMKRLRAMAEKIEGQQGEKLESPLLVLLCPSLAAKAMQERPK